MPGNNKHMMGGMGQVGLAPQATPSPPQATERELMQDLLSRASRNAVKSNIMHAPIQIGEHKEAVKKLLHEFTEAADYLQAQVPMVEAAFKSQPQLASRLVDCLNEAYYKLCSETFGKDDR